MAKIVKTEIHNGLNKFTRFIRLDQLLRTPEGRTINQILIDPLMDNVSERLLRDNLKELKDKYGADYDLNLYRGKERLWRYKDTNFSILKQTTDDLEIIRKSIDNLSLFKGDPRYDILRFYLMSLEKGVSDSGVSFMSFDNNLEVKGLEHLETILDAITNRYPLKMHYKPFNAKVFVSNIHPYHLRQYNRRWVLFAFSEENKEIFNFPLDRILRLEHLSKPYIPSDVDFEEYFDDIVGLTNYRDREVEKIVIKVDKKTIDYIRTKPVHWSQTELKELRTDQYGFIQLKVKVNTELKMLLFSYSDSIEVIEPAWLRDDFANTIEKMRDRYNK